MNRDLLLQLYFKNNLDIIRKDLGKQCTFLSYLTTKKKTETGEWQPMYGVRAQLKNDKGGIDKVEVGFQKEFQFFNPEDFDQILETLKTKSYGGASQTAV